MFQFCEGWFTELSPDQQHSFRDVGDAVKTNNDDCDGISNELWTGQAFSLQMEKVLHHAKSDFQDVLVFKSRSYGNVLVLDGVIQCTERDECAYQEMLAHPAMFAHPNPRKVLVVGGGDGGVLREVLRHESVEEAVLCEIDGMVIDVSKKYLPAMAASMSDPRAKIHVGDGFAFMKEHQNEFDVIITDSSDPVGPADSLFKKDYYLLIKGALRENGILASQAESIWLHLDLIKSMMTFCRDLYPSVAYAYASTPTYPSGVIGFLLCSKDGSNALRKPSRAPSAKLSSQLKFYSKDLHSASFTLPNFARKVLDKQ